MTELDTKPQKLSFDTFWIYVLLCAIFAGGLVLGYYWGKQSKGATASITSQKSSQWIGRFVAGDGDGRLFSAPMIELGLRSDGVIAWRTKQPEPFSLISTQQAEAK